MDFSPRENRSNYVRSTLAAYMAQLTMLDEVKRARNVQSVLDQVLEYCEMSQAAAKRNGHPINKVMVLNIHGASWTLAHDDPLSCT